MFSAHPQALFSFFHGNRNSAANAIEVGCTNSAEKMRRNWKRRKKKEKKRKKKGEKRKRRMQRKANLRHSCGEHARVVHLLLLKQSLLHEGLLLLQLQPLLHILTSRDSERDCSWEEKERVIVTEPYRNIWKKSSKQLQQYNIIIMVEIGDWNLGDCAKDGKGNGFDIFLTVIWKQKKKTRRWMVNGPNPNGVFGFGFWFRTLNQFSNLIPPIS